MRPLSEIDSKLVAIVVFGRERRNAEQAELMGVPAPRLIHYQVTIDPSQKSPSGQYIRFGAQADEIIGWQPVESIEVVEILAEEKSGELITIEPARKAA
jgi:hypothetical protein